MAEEQNIIRYDGDTYPNKTILKIGGVPVDLRGWDIQLRYKGEDGFMRIIDCVVTGGSDGKVNIYPHDKAESDNGILLPSEYISDQMEADNPDKVSNQCWNKGAAEYSFSLKRRRKFGDYEEIMTHSVGKIIIMESV